MVNAKTVDKIIINFDTKFFKKEHVILAAQAYTDSCWVLVDGSEENVTVILIPKEKMDKDILRDEFYNYVLATVKNC